MTLKVALAIPPLRPMERDQFHHAPQVGLGYVAAGLQQAGLIPKVYNSKYQGLDEERLTSLLTGESYDVVGFSAMTCEVKSVARIAKRLKLANSKCRILLGGCHSNALPLETLQEFPDIDLVCIGEHEDRIGALVSALAEGDYDVLARTPHIAYRHQREIGYSDLSRRLIADLDALAWPAYQLFGNPHAYPVILSSRGCPFNCCFCQRNSGKQVRRRDPVSVCDEIEHFTAMFDTDQFTFRDESFAVNKSHVRQICQELIKRGLNRRLRWTCETHATTADEATFSLMREAGCYYVEFGVESGSDDVLAAINKGTSRAVVEQAYQIARASGLSVGGLFILGHPNETKGSMLETIRFAARLNPEQMAFSRMTPFPGTEVYALASEHKAGLKLLTNDWEKYDNINGTPMAWDNFSLRTLKIMQLLGFFYTYLRNFRFRELLAYLRIHKNWRYLLRTILIAPD